MRKQALGCRLQAVAFGILLCVLCVICGYSSGAEKAEKADVDAQIDAAIAREKAKYVAGLTELLGKVIKAGKFDRCEEVIALVKAVDKDAAQKLEVAVVEAKLKAVGGDVKDNSRKKEPIEGTWKIVDYEVFFCGRDGTVFTFGANERKFPWGTWRRTGKNIYELQGKREKVTLRIEGQAAFGKVTYENDRADRAVQGHFLE